MMVYFIRALIIIGIVFSSGCGTFDAEKNYEVAKQMDFLGRWKEAIPIFKKVIKKSKGETFYKAQYRLGRCYYFLNDFNNSKLVCEKMLKSVPDTLDPRLVLNTKLLLVAIHRETAGYKNILNDWSEFDDK